MNDNTEKTKATIFYAKNSDSNKSSRSDKAKNESWKEKRKDHKPQSKWKSKHEKDEQNNVRIETFKPRIKSENAKQNTASRFDKSNHSHSNETDSPWQKKVRDNEQLPTFKYNDRRQRKEETLVYSENSCRAVFKHRRSAIIKMFITQEMTYQFKEVIDWLVMERLGYDVVSNDQITKMTETPHHGGICLIIKKRIPMTVLHYLDKVVDKKNDCVLAIDDVNNPHNLGGLVRSAAFFDVNGVLLRQTTLLDSGAAMRVAEGGSEAIESLKSDDFVVSLDLFKQRGYQIVALLPCQVKSIKSNELQKTHFSPKVVLMIFQQINMKLIDCADEVIHLKSSENMSSLNISVATGIALSYIRKK